MGVSQFESVIDSLPLQAQASRGGPPNPPSVTKGGDFIYEMFAAAGVKADNASDLTAMVDRTMGMLAEAQGASLSADPALRVCCQPCQPTSLAFFSTSALVFFCRRAVFVGICLLVESWTPVSIHGTQPSTLDVVHVTRALCLGRGGGYLGKAFLPVLE